MAVVPVEPVGAEPVGAEPVLPVGAAAAVVAVGAEAGGRGVTTALLIPAPVDTEPVGGAEREAAGGPGGGAAMDILMPGAATAPAPVAVFGADVETDDGICCCC